MDTNKAPGESLTYLPDGTVASLIASPAVAAASPLGPPSAWPASLTTTIATILPARAEIVLFWGPDYVAFYNDAYAPTIGDKHPRALGRPAAENWAELWDDLEPLLRGVRETGETVSARDRPFYIERHGYGETVYFDISYSPVPADDGSIGGVLCIVGETTARVLAHRAAAESEARLREETHALTIINETSRRVAAELDLDRLVQIVVDAGREVTGAAFGAFFYNRFDASGESYSLYALSGVERAAFDGFAMPRKTAVFASTFDGTAPLRSDDITLDPRYGRNAPHAGMPLGHLPVRSYLSVPVVSRGGEVIGALFFGHAEPGRFDERGEALAVALAAQAAVGIDNARLFAASQRINRELEAEVARRTAERDRVWQVSRDLLGIADLAGTWLAANPAWTRVLGWPNEDIVGASTARFVHPDDAEKTYAEIARLADGGLTEGFENRYLARDGSYRHLSWAAVNADGLFYTVARDVTEEKARAAQLEAAEEALRQAQKMETLGQLTGGVAHDFNNLLQIVTGNLDTLLRTLPEDAPRQRRAAENAMTGASRAATLTQRLLAFARRQPLSPKQTDVNRLVAGMSDLVRRTLGEVIETETVLAGGLWPIEVDPHQLETAMLNLAVNARDAMPAGGKLTIETANAHLDHAYALANAGAIAGQYVMLSLSDTGAGMDEAVLARAFEPFFTTKDVGRGTGLGLSMVYGFVKQSGGHVKIYSEPGHGTTVKLYFPRLLDAAAIADEQAARAAPVPDGTRDETILVCEDDADVRTYSVEALRELGYHVLDAGDGASALAILAQPDLRIDLLFSDVVLPGGMTGAVLAAEARRLRPDLRVLFTTGYARNAIVHHGRLDPGVELLTKPFAFADLAARVRDMLDRR